MRLANGWADAIDAVADEPLLDKPRELIGLPA